MLIKVEVDLEPGHNVGENSPWMEQLTITGHSCTHSQLWHTFLFSQFTFLYIIV